MLWTLSAPFGSGCATHYEHLVEHPLTTHDDLACTGYFVWNHEPVRDVFLVLNGSGWFSNAFVHPDLDALVDSDRVAYATYDKPGIWAPFGDPAHGRRDFAMLERYTLGHGVACATDALHWARREFGPTARLHLRAHSEGTLVALYTYAALLEAGDPTANSIETLILSGLPLESLDDILERQLTSMPNGEALRASVASCDWPVMRERLGISCAYVREARSHPSGRAMFDLLAEHAPHARFHVFQGTHDWNTPVEPVRALEAWSSEDGRLSMEFHYYDGAHRGTEAAHAEMEALLTSLVSE